MLVVSKCIERQLHSCRCSTGSVSLLQWRAKGIETCPENLHEAGKCSLLISEIRVAFAWTVHCKGKASRFMGSI